MKQLLFFGFIFSALAAGFTELHGQQCCQWDSSGDCVTHMISTPAGGTARVLLLQRFDIWSLLFRA